MSQPAGSRHRIRGSSQLVFVDSGGHSSRTKNDVAGKMTKEFEGLEEEISKAQAEIQAAREIMRSAMRSQRIHCRCLMASAAGGIVLGIFAIAADAPENTAMTMWRSII